MSCDEDTADVLHRAPTGEEATPSGKLPSMAVLYETYKPALLRRLGALTGSGEEAKDVYHEACGRLLSQERWAQVNLPERYLWRTARNIARDRRRQRAVRERLDPVALTDPPCLPSSETWLETRQRLVLVHQALRELSPVCRQAFMLRVVEEEPLATVARALSISVRMVKYHVAHALEHCQRVIAHEETPRCLHAA